jgi:hypothetical protein
MSEKYAFSSMLHLVWAVVLVLGMGFVHFYMSMIATSFDPCPDDSIDSNLKESIDKSTKYFNDIKMIHLGIAGAIILTMLIGKAIVPRDGKTVCSIVTVVLKLAACLIVVFGVSHAQNILKIRNHQCKNKIEESKIRELKILIEACIGSIGVIMGNYLSLGINNIISFGMDSSMSIIVTTVVCILLVFSIIGGDALINIFKKEMNIKNECLALNEELSSDKLKLGPVDGLLGPLLPNKVNPSGISTALKDLNAGNTVMKGIIITTEGEKYEPGSTQTVVVKFTEELRMSANESIKVIFPDGFSLEKPDELEDYIDYDVANRIYSFNPRGITYMTSDKKYTTIANVTLPKPVGFTGPIKVELHGTDGKIKQVSYNHYFDLKGDTHITFNSTNIASVSRMNVRIASSEIAENAEFTLPDGKEIYYPNQDSGHTTKIMSDEGHSTGFTGKTESKDLGSLKIEGFGDKVSVKQNKGSGNKNGHKKFKISQVPTDLEKKSKFVMFEIPVLTDQKPVKYNTLTIKGKGGKELIHKYPIEFVDPSIGDVSCPVLSRDLFMKIFLTSVMTGWAVSSIVYLSGDLYEYNSSNIALMMGGGIGVTDTAATAAAAAAAATAATQNA